MNTHEFGVYTLYGIICLGIIAIIVWATKYFSTKLQYTGIVIDIVEENFVLEPNLRRFLTDEEKTSFIDAQKVYKVTINGPDGRIMVTLSARDALRIKKGSKITVETIGSWNGIPHTYTLIGVIQY